uniref:Uncharacterized protein n=1 Tax=Angiostrongylus cantonensis TaxID=6313 RepID=A0A0K0DA47_ANGCA
MDRTSLTLKSFCYNQDLERVSTCGLAGEWCPVSGIQNLNPNRFSINGGKPKIYDVITPLMTVLTEFLLHRK